MVWVGKVWMTIALGMVWCVEWVVDNQSDLVHVQKTGNCLSANVHAVNVLLFSVILHCAARSNILTVNFTGIKIFIGQIFIASFVDFVQFCSNWWELIKSKTADDIFCMDGGLMQINRPQTLSCVHYKPIRGGAARRARNTVVSCS